MLIGWIGSKLGIGDTEQEADARAQGKDVNAFAGESADPAEHVQCMDCQNVDPVCPVCGGNHWTMVDEEGNSLGEGSAVG